MKRMTEAIVSMKSNPIGFHTYPLLEPAVWDGLVEDIDSEGAVLPSGAYHTTWATTLRTSFNTWGYAAVNKSDLGYGAAQFFEHECFGHETVSGNTALLSLPLQNSVMRPGPWLALVSLSLRGICGPAFGLEISLKWLEGRDWPSIFVCRYILIVLSSSFNVPPTWGRLPSNYTPGSCGTHYWVEEEFKDSGKFFYLYYCKPPYQGTLSLVPT